MPDSAPSSSRLPSSSLPQRGAVEAALAEVWHTPVTVERWERVGSWAVARVLVVVGGGARTVIVKWMRGGAVGASVGAAVARAESWRLANEVATLRFLSEGLGIDLAPRVIAADLVAVFVVIEDLAPRVALDELICRDGVAAHRERLAAFAAVLGELGAATAGHAEKYTAVGVEASRHLLSARWNRAYQDAVELGVPFRGEAASELAAAFDELHVPGPFLALSNGDAECNNCLVRESGPADARLIDFEAATYGHALLDAVCLHVPGPRWMSVGDPVASGLADRYRRALARGVPEAEDDRLYGFGLAAACASWALLRLQRWAVLDGRAPGDQSRLQLVETVEAAARAAATHGAVPALAGWFLRVGETLRERWTDAGGELDLAGPLRVRPYLPRV